MRWDARSTARSAGRRVAWRVGGAAVAGVAAAALAGCAGAAERLDEPQDADPEAGQLAPRQSCRAVRCGDPDAPNVLFPGNPACNGAGCERGLASEVLYIPPRNGRPWDDTYALGTREPFTLSGYSSGRIALLRRLALIGDGAHAVLLDPSWPDGARDFTGRGPERGEDIVKAWLAADPMRTFLLIHSTRSTGWAEYAALQASDIGARVKVCAVDEPHLQVPSVPDVDAALVDPDGWDNGTCAWGG
jgi:hypothetical protein